eukprot:CAMPEP_0113618816 /NCGR_PEP_ID=MMETSP0017_2-20120614/9541_1 /TAXON_ID=2856 /ORGANISM="Cylindrotheca closterium" /LENGTH=475 /DNA_ID=CAMNT_0000528355 /DNA_START=116 /DNA_END=1543 /DNA_ORIENTATION=+ /assembly_acc=CAM_ASM_000147
MPFANDASRKVVFFAGPHKAAATSVEEWFYNYYTKEDSDHFALRHWAWPIVVGPRADQLDEPWKVFQQLVLAPDDKEMKEEIMVSIQETFDGSDTGIILGTESFDQVGRYSHGDAVKAMNDVLQRLGVAKEEVTVIINYRSPRLDQWISVWKHSGVPSYRSFMCDSQDRHQLREERIEQLSTLMDPLYMAQTFVKQGWNVRVIDMEGVERANKDIVNVIACDILGGKCLMKDSIVYGHRGDETHFNVEERDFRELTEEQRQEADKLFRARDCAFEEYLSKHPKFQVGYQDNLWSDCDEQDLGREDVFVYLAGMPQALYSGLLSQFNCSEDGGLTIDELLDGEHLDNLTPEDVFADSKASNFFVIVLLPIVCILAIAYQLMKRSNDDIDDGIVMGNIRPNISDAKEKMSDAKKKIKNKLKRKDVYRDEFRDRRGMTVHEMSEVFADEDWKMSVDDDNQFSLFSKKKGDANSVSLTL